ncbi:MAG: hypothetical protein ABEK12_00490 [Candidatus Nanohaloarchaea archaeon]
MRRGTTPAVALTILLLMTASAAGGSYVLLSTLRTEAQASADADLQTRIEVKDAACRNDRVTVTMANTGDRQLPAADTTLYLHADRDLVDTAEADLSGADLTEPGGVTTVVFNLSTVMVRGQHHRLEIAFPRAGQQTRAASPAASPTPGRSPSTTPGRPPCRTRRSP